MRAAIKAQTDVYSSTPRLDEGHVVDESADGVLRLADGRRALPAVSCLVRPQPGDRVLLVSGVTGEVFVLSVLTRASGQVAQLQVPGADAIHVVAPSVTLQAVDAIRLQSLRDVELTAVTGDVSVNARNLLTTVTESLIENIKQHIAHVGTYALQVKTLLRMHSQQAIVTAEQDIKVDAERISMG
ncbi:MAG: DUF3540 domain-containing protein [Gammaproteobacteria bacterium]|nr:DUF3540 domain-containing protein [Gammaproteobacteria bacterium]